MHPMQWVCCSSLAYSAARLILCMHVCTVSFIMSSLSLIFECCMRCVAAAKLLFHWCATNSIMAVVAGNIAFDRHRNVKQKRSCARQSTFSIVHSCPCRCPLHDESNGIWTAWGRLSIALAHCRLAFEHTQKNISTEYPTDTRRLMRVPSELWHKSLLDICYRAPSVFGKSGCSSAFSLIWQRSHCQRTQQRTMLWTRMITLLLVDGACFENMAIFDRTRILQVTECVCRCW